MRKTTLLIVVFALIILFCGCGKFDVTCSIDDEFNSEMNIYILIPKDTLDENEIEHASLNLRYLKNYWVKSGYTVDYNENDTSYELSLKMSASADTLEEAYDNLTAIMSDEISPFSYVEGGYSSSYFNDIYNISAEVDLTKLVDYNTVDSFPLTQKNKVYSALDAVVGTLTFNFPGQSVDENGNISNSKDTTTLSLSEPVKLSKIMKIKNLDNQEKFDILEGEILALSEESKKYTFIVASLAFWLLIAIIIVIILTIKHKKAKKKLTHETEF